MTNLTNLKINLPPECKYSEYVTIDEGEFQDFCKANVTELYQFIILEGWTNNLPSGGGSMNRFDQRILIEKSFYLKMKEAYIEYLQRKIQGLEDDIKEISGS